MKKKFKNIKNIKELIKKLEKIWKNQDIKVFIDIIQQF
jgi:hypothetical protein